MASVQGLGYGWVVVGEGTGVRVGRVVGVDPRIRGDRCNGRRYTYTDG